MELEAGRAGEPGPALTCSSPDASSSHAACSGSRTNAARITRLAQAASRSLRGCDGFKDSSSRV